MLDLSNKVPRKYLEYYDTLGEARFGKGSYQNTVRKRLTDSGAMWTEEGWVVFGSIDLSNLELTKLPLFRLVKENFYCGNNNLTSLLGAPQVTRNFGCSSNQLCSLENGPVLVRGSLGCPNNKLTNFYKGPKYIGGSLYYDAHAISIEEFNRYISQLIHYSSLSSLDTMLLDDGRTEDEKKFAFLEHPHKEYYEDYTQAKWGQSPDLTRVMVQLKDAKAIWTNKGWEVPYGGVDLGGLELSMLPLFHEIDGALDCECNKLTSLVGCPRQISSFCADDNELQTLEGSPLGVGGLFSIDNNACLTSFCGGPAYVEGPAFCNANADLEAEKQAYVRYLEEQKAHFGTHEAISLDLLHPYLCPKEPQEGHKEQKAQKVQEDQNGSKEPNYTAKQFEALQNSGSRGFPIGGLKPIEPKKGQKGSKEGKKEPNYDNWEENSVYTHSDMKVQELTTRAFVKKYYVLELKRRSNCPASEKEHQEYIRFLKDDIFVQNLPVPIEPEE